MVEITTFGNLDIRYKSQSIFETRGCQEKILRIFSYLLLFQGQRLSQERIMDDLFAYEDYYDPRNTLRTQISRVRQMINYGNFFTITNIAGYYILKLDKESKVDFLDFENFVKQGNYLIETNPKEAIDMLEKGINLYRGALLYDINEDWIIPQRTRYDRLYLNAMERYLDLLKERNEYTRILQVAERAIGFHPYEEMINLFYIESLVALNQKQFALSHYEFYTKRLYSEYGLAPSESLKSIYERIKKGDIQAARKDKTRGTQEDTREKTSTIKEGEGLKKEYWNIDFFNSLEDLGIPQGEKAYERLDYLVLIELVEDSKEDSGLVLKEYTDQLVDYISSKLRTDDSLYRCVNGPLLLKLKGVSYHNIQSIQARIEEKLQEFMGDDKFHLKIKAKLL